jgi:hypothetical protein
VSLKLPQGFLSLADSEAYFAANLDLEAGWRVYFETLEINSLE